MALKQRGAPPLPGPARAYLWLMTLGAAALLVYWLETWRGPIPADPGAGGTFAVLLALGILAQHFPLMVSPRYKVDVSIAVYFAALLRFGAPAALALVGASHLAGQATLALRRHPVSGLRLRSPRSVLFNTSQFVIATGLGALVCYTLLPHAVPVPLDGPESLWAIGGAAVAMYLTNTLAVAVMVALQRGENPILVWLAGQRVDALQFSGLFLVGLATALTSIHYPWAPLVMAMPAALLHLSLQRTMQLLTREQAARAEAEAAAERIQRLQASIEQEWAPLEAVLAGMSDGVIALDDARRVRYCNARAAALLELTPEAAVGQHAGALVGQLESRLADALGACATLEQIITHPQTHPSGELTLLGPPQRVVLVSAFPVAAASGVRLGLVLRDVTDSKVRAIFEERERIAMDLHDGVIQSLYGVVLALGAHERRCDGRDTALRAGLRQEIAKINGIIQEIRNYIFDLRTEQRAPDGLAEGLAAIVEELRVNSLIRVQLLVSQDAADLLSPDAMDGLLHIAREATSNVVRHARANALTIRLMRVDDRLVLAVRDDGEGFDLREDLTPSGQGLRNMAERAKALGGCLDLQSRPGAGTEVRVELPVPREQWEHDRSEREAVAGR